MPQPSERKNATRTFCYTSPLKKSAGVIATTSEPVLSDEEDVVSLPSRFQPLAAEEEEEEGEEEADVFDHLEEGDILLEEKLKERKISNQVKSSKKGSRPQINRSKDLKPLNIKGHFKKSSIRKI